jgi:hypothetical protein
VTLAVTSSPLSVGLKFGMLAVLYLFLLWVARSALKDARRTTAPASDGTGVHMLGGGRPPATDASLVALNGGGLPPGERYDLFGGLSIGRSTDADVRIDDRFASQLHARVDARGGEYFLEDLQSTNGTYLNGSRVNGEVPLSDLDQVKIGDTEFRFELDVPA